MKCQTLIATDFAEDAFVIRHYRVCGTQSNGGDAFRPDSHSISDVSNVCPGIPFQAAILLGTGTSGQEDTETNRGIVDDVPAGLTVGGPVEATRSTWISKTGSVVAVHLQRLPRTNSRAPSGPEGGHHLAGGRIDDGVPVDYDGWDRLVAISHRSDEGSCVGIRPDVDLVD